MKGNNNSMEILSKMLNFAEELCFEVKIGVAAKQILDRDFQTLSWIKTVTEIFVMNKSEKHFDKTTKLLQFHKTH